MTPHPKAQHTDTDRTQPQNRFPNGKQPQLASASATYEIKNEHGEVINTSTGLSNKKLLMWAFLGSDVMFFGSFIATYLVYRNRSLVGPYPADILEIPITSVSQPSCC